MKNSTITIRKALLSDLPSIVWLLFDDELGSKRECYQDPLPKKYLTAFSNIDSDKNSFLIIVEDEGNVIGTMQLNIIQYLTYQGGQCAQIEGVRIAKNHRGQGIGKIMFEWAISKARELQCRVVQLTTDKKRPDALVFYQKLGFIASHEGLKLHL
ncbi:MAG: GNAT family N-acetyltransferase [Coxiellaceae bacterium]|nr:GNAT family N-acetyltransferase [Coxiellaceae bacterium]